MPWYNFLALFFFLGSFAVFLGVLGYSEFKKNKAYVKMLEQREKYYFWGTEWYYRECGGTE